MKNCEKCGTELRKTNWDREFCMNCGIKGIENIESDEENPSYIN